MVELLARLVGLLAESLGLLAEPVRHLAELINSGPTNNPVGRADRLGPQGHAREAKMAGLKQPMAEAGARPLGLDRPRLLRARAGPQARPGRLLTEHARLGPGVRLPTLNWIKGAAQVLGRVRDGLGRIWEQPVCL